VNVEKKKKRKKQNRREREREMLCLKSCVCVAGLLVPLASPYDSCLSFFVCVFPHCHSGEGRRRAIYSSGKEERKRERERKAEGMFPAPVRMPVAHDRAAPLSIYSLTIHHKTVFFFFG